MTAYFYRSMNVILNLNETFLGLWILLTVFSKMRIKLIQIWKDAIFNYDFKQLNLHPFLKKPCTCGGCWYIFLHSLYWNSFIFYIPGNL